MKAMGWMVAVVVCLAAMACTPPGPPPSAGGGSDEHAHDHGHAHGHAHDDAGPSGGHVVELGDEQYHIEWLHDDNAGLVTMFVLDADAAHEFPITADAIRVEIATDQGSQEFLLEPVDRAEGLAAKFETNSPPLIEALKAAGNGVEATVSVQIGDETFSQKLEHAHGDAHGHAH